MTRSYDEADRLLELFTELHEPGGMSDAAVMCAWAPTAQSRQEAAVDAATRALRWAEELLGESLEISRRYDDRYPEVLSMLALAKIAAHTDGERARATAGKALTIAREYRMSHHIADALGLLGELELAAGRPEQAAGYLTESMAMWRTRGWLSFQAAALTNLGRALTDLDPPAARQSLTEALDLYEQLDDFPHGGHVAELLRDVTPDSPTSSSSTAAHTNQPTHGGN